MLLGRKDCCCCYVTNGKTFEVHFPFARKTVDCFFSLPEPLVLDKTLIAVGIVQCSCYYQLKFFVLGFTLQPLITEKRMDGEKRKKLFLTHSRKLNCLSYVFK